MESHKIFTKKCFCCGNLMTRRKKSEAERINWLFCSRKCQVITNNKSRKIMLGSKTCPHCNQTFNRNKATQSYCSAVCAVSFRNKHSNPSKSVEARLKIARCAKNRGTGHMNTTEAKEKQRVSILGKNHWNWQGGLTHNNKRLRNTKKHREWVKSILKRDNYTCQICLVRGGTLEVDHIKPFAFFPELRTEDSNARTLCTNCHKKTDTYMGRAYKHRMLASR